MLAFSIAGQNALRAEHTNAPESPPVIAPPMQNTYAQPRSVTREAPKPPKPQAPAANEDPTAELAKLLL